MLGGFDKATTSLFVHPGHSSWHRIHLKEWQRNHLNRAGPDRSVFCPYREFSVVVNQLSEFVHESDARPCAHHFGQGLVTQHRDPTSATTSCSATTPASENTSQPFLLIESWIAKVLFDVNVAGRQCGRESSKPRLLAKRSKSSIASQSGNTAMVLNRFCRAHPEGFFQEASRRRDRCPHA